MTKNPEQEMGLVPQEEISLKGVPSQPSLVLSEDHVESVMANINLLTAKFSEWLVEDEDYTVRLFPGQKKPALLDPGATKLRSFFRAYPKHRVLERVVETEEGEERIRYVVEATLYHINGVPVASGVGSCSSDEKRYKYRWINEDDLRKVYGFEDEDLQKLKSRGQGGRRQLYVKNPEILDLDNTLLKMAAKRAEVDATLMLPGVSSIFTQDVGKRAGKKGHECKKVSANRTDKGPMLRSGSRVDLNIIEYNLKAIDVGEDTVGCWEDTDSFIVEPERDLSDDEHYKISGMMETLGAVWEEKGRRGWWRIDKRTR